MKSTLIHVLFGSAVLLAVAGCSSDPNSLGDGSGDQPGGGGPGAGGGGGGGGGGGTGPACTDKGKAYVGFAGTQLVADRIEFPVGQDRDRVKPFSALQTEYPRVLGASPASLAKMGPTFGQSQARWYDEPEANAVSIYSAFSVAFDGCLTYTASDAKYAAAPDATSAPIECASMARKFWSRDATPDEVTACVTAATSDTSSETNPRRKWAYTCASVLSAAGFLTY